MKQGDATLVLHLGALGDLMLALPAIARLPGTLEAWGPAPERLALALAPRGPLARVAPLPTELFREPEADEIDRRLAAFERIVAFARDDGGPLARRVRGRGGKLVCPFPAPAPRDDPGARHASRVILDDLEAQDLSLAPGPRFPVLHASPDDLASADALLRERGVAGAPVVVHPGAGGRAKRWAPSSFAAAARGIAQGLAARGEPAPVIAVLGPAELDGPACAGERLEGIARTVLEAPRLAVLAGVLARARLFLGNDAGIAHMAAAFGAPSVVVFGPTDPRVWAPRGRAPVRIVEAPDGELDRLDPAAVVAAALEILSP